MCNYSDVSAVSPRTFSDKGFVWLKEFIFQSEIQHWALYNLHLQAYLDY